MCFGNLSPIASRASRSDWTTRSLPAATPPRSGTVSKSQTMTFGLMQVECPRLRITKFLAVWKLQYRCAGLSICPLMACHLVQAREPAAGIVAIDIPAVLDCAGAINNLSGLIEFKRYLGQAVEIAVWMRAHHKRNLWFGEPDFSCRFHQTPLRVRPKTALLLMRPTVGAGECPSLLLRTKYRDCVHRLWQAQ